MTSVKDACHKCHEWINRCTCPPDPLKAKHEHKFTCEGWNHNDESPDGRNSRHWLTCEVSGCSEWIWQFPSPDDPLKPKPETLGFEREAKARRSKVCVRCGTTYYHERGGTYWWRKRKYCNSKCFYAAAYEANHARTTRRCKACKRELPLAMFKGPRETSMPRSDCRPCSSAKERIRYRLKPRKKGSGSKPDPVKNRARSLLQSAVRYGKIARQPCVKCGAKAQAHHPDYSKPYDVIWLCRIHHGMEHWKKLDTPLEWMSYAVSEEAATKQRALKPAKGERT